MVHAERRHVPRGDGHRGLILALVVGACLVATLLLASAVVIAVNGLILLPESARSLSSSAETFDAQQVHDLRVSWGLGPVVVKRVAAEETGGGVLIQEEYLDSTLEAYPMITELSHGELSVYYGVDSVVSRGNEGKRLTVLVPEEEGTLGEVSLSIANDELDLRDLACETLRIEVASGIVRAQKVTADQLDLEVSSGDAEVDGSFKRSAAVELGSGNLLLATDVTPHDTSMQVASGSAVLKLPRKAGFTAHVQMASGDFNLEFASEKKGDTYVVGHGENRVDVSVASGSVSIVKR